MSNTMRALKVELFLADPIVCEYSGPLSADPQRLKLPKPQGNANQEEKQHAVTVENCGIAVQSLKFFCLAQ